MSKSVIELCARAVAYQTCIDNGEEEETASAYENKFAREHITQVKAMLTTLAANLDEEALKAAQYEIEKSTVRGNKLENAIQSYLNTLIKEDA